MNIKRKTPALSFLSGSVLQLDCVHNTYEGGCSRLFFDQTTPLTEKTYYQPNTCLHEEQKPCFHQ
jgi:hypothetical protein